MPKKYYTFTAYSIDELTCFSSQEIYYRLLREKITEAKAKAITKLVDIMEPTDYLIFEIDDSSRVCIRCWTYEND